MFDQMNKVCVYCGSSSGRTSDYITYANQLADVFLSKNIELVYGGASIGVMGALANRMIARGGRVTGVIPKALAEKEIAHSGLTNLHVVESMHNRKMMMAELADGFIALPGGMGTFEELFEVLTWAQLGFHHKPCGLLNSNRFYDQLISFLNHAVDEKFIKPVHRDLLLVSSDPAQLVEKMENYSPIIDDKWISETET
ncbi:TIGR00730 family Rossman fold protein [Sessilibacter corallicola]|uniref:LOG family protein n=1 Tax=Sessilibacter corallicola TaxID=2904075 RepID=UPI001E346FF3|nr:TIGR00730 family Rossman fold protein [Sessilibacter corallicola]MCE2030297.1 TIGR00730 family Rossman fold protein [Sessilibacter corallicola]